MLSPPKIQGLKKRSLQAPLKMLPNQQHKSFGNSVHTEEPSHIVKESGMQQDQEFVTRDNDEHPIDKEDSKVDRKPLPLIQDHRGRQIIPKDYFINKDLEYLKGGDSSRQYSTSVTKTKAVNYELKWIKDLVPELWSHLVVNYDKHAYFGTSRWGPKRESLYRYASNLTSSKDVYFKRRIIAVTRLIIMKKYNYGHLEEIKVCQDDQQLYKFKEGDFKRLRLQDIEYIRIIIQKRMEDLQLGVKSYQKKLNLTKPDTYRSNLRNKTAYTLHSDPHGIIHMDQSKRKRLMRTDELHKFSDGTLSDVRTALHDIAAGLRMDHLPMRKWSNLDKKRARVMV
uniref:Uncharacterized protein n=1 Tax=Tanacetum cinerariifolium TaxID=118510 RepID=A0A699JXW7_TANCI|nr:hypothetical protein [Tanacetum cinerariifolium]